MIVLAQLVPRDMSLTVANAILARRYRIVPAAPAMTPAAVVLHARRAILYLQTAYVVETYHNV